MMKGVLTITTLIISVVTILVSVAVSIYLFPQMPDSMASHWDASGEVNGYMSKFWGLFLMPMVAFGVLILFAVLPALDPLKKNFEAYRDAYNELVLVLLLFLLYIHAMSLIWNLGVKYDMSQMVVGAIGLLLIFMARLLRKTKRNWFVGIRTPWTLSSDTVWDKTHALGYQLFRIAGIISLLGVFAPQYMMLVMFVSIFGAVIVTVVYSYVVYRKEKEAV
jgi:uncharacterized membrane protein